MLPPSPAFPPPCPPGRRHPHASQSSRTRRTHSNSIAREPERERDVGGNGGHCSPSATHTSSRSRDSHRRRSTSVSGRSRDKTHHRDRRKARERTSTRSPSPRHFPLPPLSPLADVEAEIAAVRDEYLDLLKAHQAIQRQLLGSLTRLHTLQVAVASSGADSVCRVDRYRAHWRPSSFPPPSPLHGESEETISENEEDGNDEWESAIQRTEEAGSSSAEEAEEEIDLDTPTEGRQGDHDDSPWTSLADSPSLISTLATPPLLPSQRPDSAYATPMHTKRGSRDALDGVGDGEGSDGSDDGDGSLGSGGDEASISELFSSSVHLSESLLSPAPLFQGEASDLLEEVLDTIELEEPTQTSSSSNSRSSTSGHRSCPSPSMPPRPSPSLPPPCASSSSPSSSSACASRKGYEATLHPYRPNHPQSCAFVRQVRRSLDQQHQQQQPQQDIYVRCDSPQVKGSRLCVGDVAVTGRQRPRRGERDFSSLHILSNEDGSDRERPASKI
ncbi:unnamed protein product [Vitrella brassicaformis CCMP3155]|uniref:Uncharacterized protein n=1 Tax=Vitrella brassicaformis (strain CCMP3155) TaxID=1169540 RepID=A0A0G4EYW2_VITBC|nr:unnamed protein product [Vitrella brassicaformis CCMP3155]|mmetsp:Transcript_8509/g.24267  ORF Transcript_8509/g.24267 Transcript_8509/m.24267 type:complete len:501 (+) Transcript_8509:53-1555(+)|eukprot:CEM04264.1 unnamed protein product [Vitrella brassicaformis CCMP3155]